MPRYRILFPCPEGTSIENTPTAHLDSGDTVYAVGDVLEHDGQSWKVTQAPLEDDVNRDAVDLMVWPVE
ncbi:MAG: hypothetical protein WCH31_07890 [Actinomycetes bacterium]